MGHEVPITAEVGTTLLTHNTKAACLHEAAFRAPVVTRDVPVGVVVTDVPARLWWV